MDLVRRCCCYCRKIGDDVFVSRDRRSGICVG